MSSLPAVITPALLSSIRGHPNLPADSWYLIAAVTLCMLNRPDEIPKVYEHAMEHGPADHEGKLNMSRRMREALIKATAVGGVPKIINAMLELKRVTPPELLDKPTSGNVDNSSGTAKESPTGRRAEVWESDSAADILVRGVCLFENIYGKVSRRVLQQMDYSGTEDLRLVAQLMYGYIISNMSVLSEKDTSFVMIAGLIPQDVNPQLKGHLRGALNVQATVDEVRAVREVAIQICTAAGMSLLDPSVPGGFGWRSEVANVSREDKSVQGSCTESMRYG